MIDYVIQMVEKFASSNDYEWCILVPASEVDGIDQALEDYVNEQESDWLGYDIQPLINSADYIVRLY